MADDSVVQCRYFHFMRFYFVSFFPVIIVFFSVIIVLSV